MERRFFQHAHAWILISSMILGIWNAEAKITLSPIFCSHMVLQQKSMVTLKGHSSRPLSEISIQPGWSKHSFKTNTDQHGNWNCELSTPKAGGPYELIINDGDELKLSDILIGEVWLYAGEYDLQHIPKETGSNSEVRLLQVARQTSMRPCNILSPTTSAWTPLHSTSSGQYEITAFAQFLHRSLKCPVGIICCTSQESPIEAWSSYQALKGMPEQHPDIKVLEEADFNPNILEQKHKEKIEDWYNALYQHDEGWCDDHQVWAETSYKDQSWEEMKLPGYWEEQGLKDFDGVIWFRKTIEIPRSWHRKMITLYLGHICDEDIAFFNGTEIGRSKHAGTERIYTIPAKLVRRGKAVITLRVTNYQGKGGVQSNADQLRMEVKGKQSLSLAGTWKYAAGFSLKGIPPVEPSPNENPEFVTTLFNGMIAPLIGFPLKGIIWHHGSRNEENAEDYAALQLSLIADWREQWKQPELPFLWIQHPSDIEQSNVQVCREATILRAAQAEALALTHTGMIVTTDLYASGTQPQAIREEIGFRLSQQALATAYGRKRINAYPSYQSYSIEQSQIRIRFQHMGKRIREKTSIQGFYVAGVDRKFYPATVTIERNELVLQAPQVPHPVAARYNWSDRTTGTLCGESGLPLLPFRTDSW